MYTVGSFLCDEYRERLDQSWNYQGVELRLGMDREDHDSSPMDLFPARMGRWLMHGRLIDGKQ
jgi:hypothetical protein